MEEYLVSLAHPTRVRPATNDIKLNGLIIKIYKVPSSPILIQVLITIQVPLPLETGFFSPIRRLINNSSILRVLLNQQVLYMSHLGLGIFQEYLSNALMVLEKGRVLHCKRWEMSEMSPCVITRDYTERRCQCLWDQL